MYEYIIPSISAYHKRKLFHSNESSQYETIRDWFHRVFDSLDGCEFGEYSDFMFIDKFIAGIDFDSFQKYKINTKLTIDEVFSISCDNGNGIDNETISELENLHEAANDVLAEIEIKVEEDEVNSQNECDNNQQLNNQMVILDSNLDCSKIENQENIETRDNELDQRNGIDDYTDTPKEIKGFKRDKSRNIICLDCGKSFKQKNSYNYHKRIHTGSGLFYCMICAKRFVKKIQLQMHMPTHDHENKSLECYLCSSKFDRLHGLRIHFTISHTVRTKRNLQCSMCNRAFSKQQDLDLHIKVHRGLIEGHKCQQCDKIFDKLSTLKEHLVVHLNTKEFVCETCGRAFKTKHLLKKHAHSHNNDRCFKCCECGQVLKSTATLKIHMRQHTGERPYSCTLCEKNFVTRPSLAKHLRVHRQERPHGCTVCCKRFATAYHLKLHMHTHTGAKPYACNQCGRAFTQLGTLKAHQLKAHPQENSDVYAI